MTGREWQREAGEETDWRRARAEFSITERMAYLNSAGTGPVSRQVLDAAAGFYQDVQLSGDRRWEEWAARRESAREAVAGLINAEPDEVAFTTNTSAGINLIVDALEGRGQVISCELEFPVSTITWMHRGIRVHLVKAVEGELRTEDVLRSMTDETKVICLSHVQYSNGFRLDPEEIGRNKGQHAFVINASQSAGALPIDVKRMRIDALCATGHKWMLAGFGSGFVYLSRELMAETRPRAVGWMSVENPFEMRNDSYTLREDASARSEMGCPHFAGIFALGASVREMLELGVERIERRALALNRHLTERLTEAGWKVLSPLKREAARSAETLVAARHPRRLVAQLNSHGIAVSIKPEGFRVSTHFFNDEEDIARLIKALGELGDG